MDTSAIAGKAEEFEPQSYSWESRRIKRRTSQLQLGRQRNKRRTPELQLGRQKKVNPRAIAGKAEEEEPQSYSWEGTRR